MHQRNKTAGGFTNFAKISLLTITFTVVVGYIACNFWGPSAPKRPKKLVGLHSGSAALQGARKTMEDEHVAFDSMVGNTEFNQKQLGVWISQENVLGYYGVYDGHIGRRAAEVTAQELHKTIVAEPEFGEGDVQAAYQKAFLQFDEDLLCKAKD